MEFATHRNTELNRSNRVVKIMKYRPELRMFIIRNDYRLFFKSIIQRFLSNSARSDNTASSDNNN